MAPKLPVKVEIDVPQTCSYIVRTPECTLSEVSDVDPAGLLCVRTCCWS
uniref:Uncharacterized protein n=1 Tax=Anguilla anguilla TaxID=7936 RepID=A0A0E9TM86_ANGAN